jgi:hypothetical protein
MNEKKHQVGLCVIGGGLAGMCAAIAAARHGVRVLIMQDRPVFGGNSSSEIRMWVCGAAGENRRETGIIEEIQLENIYRNPNKVYSIWDSVLWEKVVFEPNITALMNCTCLDARMDGSRIDSVRGWQMTTQTYHSVSAEVFADCSGDSVLAPLIGAEFRVGREARSEFNESIEPETADTRTMGMSCLIQARELDRPVTFTPPKWARYFASAEDVPNRDINPFQTNFWWIELGGTDDTIADAESIKGRLLAAAFGVWDLIKNRSGIPGVKNLELEWLGFLPGKRESRRYVGDHIITQNDVLARGPFEDVVAYGGWSMDDHPPQGLNHPGEPTTFHEAPSPWGIPFRSLYSRNISNLYFAGRNISATHIALASSRVMRTCAVIGQAVGTAAAIGITSNLSPREVGRQKLDELQSALMDDDCWIPGGKRRISALSLEAGLSASFGNPEPLRSGIDRPTEKNPADAFLPVIRHADEGGKISAQKRQIEWNENAWVTRIGEGCTYAWGGKRKVSSARLVFDSNLNRYYREMRMLFGYFKSYEPISPPPELVKDFSLEYRTADNEWVEIVREKCNYQRLVKLSFGPIQTDALRLSLHASWGSEVARVFAFECA